MIDLINFCQRIWYCKHFSEIMQVLWLVLLVESLQQLSFLSLFCEKTLWMKTICRRICGYSSSYFVLFSHPTSEWTGAWHIETYITRYFKLYCHKCEDFSKFFQTKILDQRPFHANPLQLDISPAIFYLGFYGLYYHRIFEGTN